MLLKTVSFDQFAEYLMSEEHNLLELHSSTIWIIFPGRYRRGYCGGEFKCGSPSRALYEGDR